MAVVHFNDWRGWTAWDPSTRLDRAIPAVGWSILPYLSLYLYYLLVVVVAPRGDRGRHELLLLAQVQIVITAISLTVFLLLPCEIHLREDLPAELREGIGIWGALFGLLHGVDRPWNAWPSLHVSVTVVIVLAVCRWHPPLRFVLWPAWTLLAISTLTTKQHYLIDVGTGTLLGGYAWRAWLEPGLRGVARLGRGELGPPRPPWLLHPRAEAPPAEQARRRGFSGTPARSEAKPRQK